MKVSEYRPSITEVIEACGGEVPDGQGWVSVSCPFHDDEHSSASINEDEGLFKCFGCEVSGDAYRVLMKAHGVTLDEARQMLNEMQVTSKPTHRTPAATLRRNTKNREMLKEATALYHSNLDLASDYLKSRGITRTAAQAAQLGVVKYPLPGHEPYRHRLSIPYITTSGVVSMKFRCMQDHRCKDHGHNKYLSVGGDSRMYHVTSVLTHQPYIAVTEGEMDAIVLNHLCGVPAVGIPGATNWKAHYARVLEGFDRILVVGDGDKAGGEFARAVAKHLETGVSIVFPEGQDVNSVYLSDGRDAVLSLLGVA